MVLFEAFRRSISRISVASHSFDCENGMFCKSGKRSLSDLKISMLNDVIGGVLRIERMKSSLVLIVKMVCFARVGKEVGRFEDFHVERCHWRNTRDRTHEMEHFEDFCRIPSLHGENGMFCKSGKRSLSDLKISILNDVIVFPERLGEGRFLGAVSLSSLT